MINTNKIGIQRNECHSEQSIKCYLLPLSLGENVLLGLAQLGVNVLANKREHSQAADHVDLVGDLFGNGEASELTNGVDVSLASVLELVQTSLEHLFDQMRGRSDFQGVAKRLDASVTCTKRLRVCSL